MPRAGLSYRGKAPLRTTSQSRFARQGRVAAPSVCFAAARILLAAAPTAPPCFRHWRRSSPLPLVGEPLAKPFTLRGLPKPPLGRGGGSASALTERLSPAVAHGQALSSYNLSVSLRSPRPGCGSQRLLRCRSHPAGRGPNSSSLFPPLAAVVAVAPSRGASGETVHSAGTAKASPR